MLMALERYFQRARLGRETLVSPRTIARQVNKLFIQAVRMRCGTAIILSILQRGRGRQKWKAATRI